MGIVNWWLYQGIQLILLEKKEIIKLQLNSLFSAANTTYLEEKMLQSQWTETKYLSKSKKLLFFSKKVKETVIFADTQEYITLSAFAFRFSLTVES